MSPEFQTLLVKKEPHRKVLTILPRKELKNADLEVINKPRGVKQNKLRQRRSVQAVVRFFQLQGHRKTCSVFCAKAVTTDEMRLMRLVARQQHPDVDLQFVGVAESADSGPHAHFIVFKYEKGVPNALPVNEERELCWNINMWLTAWRSRTNKNIRPSRYLNQKTALASVKVEDEIRGLYRVPTVLVEGRAVPSGMQHYAVGYTLKTLLVPARAPQFLGSVGIGGVVSIAKSHQEVRLKDRRLWDKRHSTYRFDLVSIAAYEAEKQLRYLDPRDVCVYIKYGRVYVETKGRLKLYKNKYLLVGLELLRRDLADFTASSVLRRCVTKVCKVLGEELRCLTTDELNDLANKTRDQIVWAD